MSLGEITTDPFLIGNGSFHLQPTSPCINTGLFPMLDPDLTRSDMGCYYYPMNTGSLTFDITPVNPPIQIPPGGGYFQFSASLQNTTPNTAALQVWIDVTKPNGLQSGTIVGPIPMVVPAGVSITQPNLDQVVPGNIPPGTYIYHVYIGNYPYNILDQGSLTFLKLTDEALPGGEGEWACTGWDLLGQATSLAAPQALDLKASPNPFNPSTVASYELRATSA